MEVKRNGNNINIYDGEKLILHLDKYGDVYTAINNFVKISAKLEKTSESTVKVSEVLLKKINGRGKMVRNTSTKWIRHYTTWLQSVCSEYGLF